MKRLLILITILFACLFSYSQDTVFVYQEEGMIRINDLEPNPIFLTPGQVSYKISGNLFKIRDGITKLEYTVGSFDEIFQRDTTNFPTQDSTIAYLSKILNRRVSDVNIQDQTTDPLIIKFNRIDASTTIKAATALSDTFITVNSVVGAHIGDYILAFSPSQERIYKGNILSINADTLFVDSPLDVEFEADDYLDYTTSNMNVDGHTTTQTFGLRGVSPQPVGFAVDITRIIFHCLTDAAVDLSKFGDIAGGLTNGLVLRKRDGETFNIFNVKTNGELAAIGYDFSAQQATNPAQGQDGFLFRLTFGGQSKIGVVIRLEPGEDLEFLIRDDLSDIDLFEVIAEGHIVED